jgi:hypothetical protein
LRDRGVEVLWLKARQVGHQDGHRRHRTQYQRSSSSQPSSVVEAGER